jgi:hypothetical protein
VTLTTVGGEKGRFLGAKSSSCLFICLFFQPAQRRMDAGSITRSTGLYSADSIFRALHAVPRGFARVHCWLLSSAGHRLLEPSPWCSGDKAVLDDEVSSEEGVWLQRDPWLIRPHNDQTSSARAQLLWASDVKFGIIVAGASAFWSVPSAVNPP